jgi:hypothetical protein
MCERNIFYDVKEFKRYKGNIQHKKDVMFGLKQENEYKPILEKFFNVKLNHTKAYDTYDYYNKEECIYIELKSRRISKNTYHDTMINYGKYMKLKQMKIDDPTIRIYIIYNFIDILCYYELCVDHKFRIGNGGTSKRGFNERSQHIYIPISYLKDIS